MSINPRTMSFVTSDALRALCLSFVLASFTDPGVMSLVAWTGAGTAWAENFVWTGSVAFRALSVLFVSSINSGTVPFVGKVWTAEAGARYVLRSMQKQGSMHTCQHPPASRCMH